MTDRERLLEMVREQEAAAESLENVIRYFCDTGAAIVAGDYARRAAHHALTALALREAIAAWDADDKGLDGSGERARATLARATLALERVWELRVGLLSRGDTL